MLLASDHLSFLLGLMVNLPSSSDIIRLFNIYSSILQVTCQRKVIPFLCFVLLCLVHNFITSKLCITLVAHKTIKVSKISNLYISISNIMDTHVLVH